MDDEEALHWAGDEVTGREGARVPVPKVRDAAETPAGSAPVARAAGRAGTTPLTILFGVLYLVITVGWVLGVGYTSAGSTALFPQLTWQFAEFTAIIAAPIWFATTVLLTPGKLAVRVGVLALGLGMLLPWPVLPLLAVS